MSVKTRRGSVLLPVVVVVVLAAVFVPKLKDELAGVLGRVTGGTETVGKGSTAFMVAKSAAGHVHTCVPAEELDRGECDGLKFVIMDAAKMPFITRNISMAWKVGKPGVLTKDSAAQPANRRVVCLDSFPRKFGGECDEYPFATTRQGGSGAQEQEVPAAENRCQGGTLARRYDSAGIKDGDDFLVVIIHPDLVADHPYRGEVRAADPTCP